MNNNEIFLNIVEEHCKITDSKNIDKEVLEIFYDKCYKVKENWEELLIENNNLITKILMDNKNEILKNKRELEYLINELIENIEFYNQSIKNKKEYYIDSIFRCNLKKKNSLENDLKKLNKIKFDNELNFTIISKNIIQLQFRNETLNEQKNHELILLRKKNINDIYYINNFKDSKRTILENIEENKKKKTIYENEINDKLFNDFDFIEKEFNEKKDIFINNINNCESKIINNKNKEEIKTLNLEILYYKNKILNFDKDLYNEKIKLEYKSIEKINNYKKSICNLNYKLERNINKLQDKYFKFIDNYDKDNNINNIKTKIIENNYTITKLENKNVIIYKKISNINNKIKNLIIDEENTKKLYINLLTKNYNNFIKQKKFINIIIKNKEETLKRYKKKKKNNEKLLVDIIINKNINSHGYNMLKRKKIFLLKKIDYLNKLFLII